MSRYLLFGTAALVALARGAAAQIPVVDTVVIETRNIFGPEEAKSSFFFQLTNALHFTSQPFVVRRELLFATGEPYDSARVAETERNLRRLGIFRRVTIDTVRLGERLAVRIVTSDGWSTNLNLGARSTGDVFTWNLGLFEQNFLGTANQVGVDYRQEVDRNALRLVGRLNRVFGSRLTASGFYDELSDGGYRGTWASAVPFRSLSERSGIAYEGEVARQRLLRFRNGQQFAEYWRTALVHRTTAAWAPRAGPDGYVRLGLMGQVRREELVPLDQRDVPIPDTVTAAVGAFAELYRPKFVVVTHYNGFAREEDVDLSTRLTVGTWVAPSGFGYRSTGVAPAVAAQTGFGVPALFARLEASAHGLLNDTGLDSGRVQFGLTIGSRLIDRQTTIVHIEGGMAEAPVPSTEFDLGHGIGPRAFDPHAFTGNRSIWGTIEHRVFLLDDFLGMVGVGIAGFFDYGGAWFDDQAARLGGNVGFGLRLGTTRSIGANVGRFDYAFRFGDGVGTDRWKFSFGRAILF